jgi:hypothetical protein
MKFLPNTLSVCYYLNSKDYTAVVPKVCSADTNGSATSSPETRAYISVMATFRMIVRMLETPSTPVASDSWRN